MNVNKNDRKDGQEGSNSNSKNNSRNCNVKIYAHSHKYISKREKVCVHEIIMEQSGCSLFDSLFLWTYRFETIPFDAYAVCIFFSKDIWFKHMKQTWTSDIKSMWNKWGTLELLLLFLLHFNLFSFVYLDLGSKLYVCFTVNFFPVITYAARKSIACYTRVVWYTKYKTNSTYCMSHQKFMFKIICCFVEIRFWCCRRNVCRWKITSHLFISIHFYRLNAGECRKLNGKISARIFFSRFASFA